MTPVATRRRRKLPIRRERTNEGFTYRLRGRKITKRSEIERLEALVIPPAWEHVEISQSSNAKILARGIDAAGRTQAIYHTSFRRRQDRRKFDRMLQFGRALPRLRARVDRDLRRRRLSRDRVTACVIRLIDLQFFRIGNPEYAKSYRSYGVTTLRESHLTTTTSSVEFDFTGKSGKRQRRRVQDARIARLIAQLVEIPGPEVFRFFDEDGLVHDIRSRHVNAYVKRHMGGEFTAKDFRTWGGTMLVASALLELDASNFTSKSSRESAIRNAIAVAAERLGNTPAITRSSYIDPRVLQAVESPEMLGKVRRMRTRARKYLTGDEQRAIKLLAAQANHT